MNSNEVLSIQHLLKTHYGATTVVVDNDLLFVYGGDVDAVYAAVVIEFGHEFDVVYEKRSADLKEVVLRLVKNIPKVVDESKND